jgi:hypothetical protein
VLIEDGLHLLEGPQARCGGLRRGNAHREACDANARQCR